MLLKKKADFTNVAERVANSAIRGYEDAVEGSYGVIIVEEAGKKMSIIWRLIKHNHHKVEEGVVDAIKTAVLVLIEAVYNGESVMTDTITCTVPIDAILTDLFDISITVKKIGGK